MSWRVKAPFSLSLQFSLWYTGVSFLLLLLGSGWVYFQMVRAYDTIEVDFLFRKAVTLRQLALQHDLPALRWEIDGSSRALSRVIAPNGSIVNETKGMSKELPEETFPPAGQVSEKYGGRLYRMLTIGSPEGYRIQVARDYTLLTDVFSSYRWKLWTFLGIGLLLSTQSGFMIARRGMRPVQEIADTLRQIGSSTLGDRVKTNGLPSELLSLATTFNQTLDRLEDAFVRMDSFSSDIAHELRTPVATLRGQAEVALSRVRSAAEYQEVLESSLEEYVRLSTIIDRLLFLARAENPSTQIHPEPVDIGKELEIMREFYEALAADARIDLAISVPPALTALVDRTLLQRALSNLIENSLAHTSAGGRILLEAHNGNGSLVISVVDDGCGIPAEHLPRVFDRFHRVDAARSPKNANAGLGLAIVKSVASLHGGEAVIFSDLGAGTRVTLTLPLV